MTIQWQDAYTGSDAYVSAVIVDASGKVCFYGSIAHNAAAGAQGLKIPADLATGKYTLKVITETRRGDQKTDWAKEGMTVPLTVTAAPVVPKTGDGAHPALWTALAVVSAVCLGWTALRGQRKRANGT